MGPWNENWKSQMTIKKKTKNIVGLGPRGKLLKRQIIIYAVLFHIITYL